MKDYRKAAHWQNPANKLFPHQVGFTCPPHDFDAAPSDFLRMAPPTVGVHGRMLHAPDYDYALAQRKQQFHLLEEFVHCMANNGVDVCGQVGSNWAHACGLGVDGVRAHCEMLSDKYQTPFHMAGYALVEALRECNIARVALNAAYHRPEWWQGTVAFLEEAGVEVAWAGNFFDQGWFASQQEVDDCHWCFDAALARKSFLYVAERVAELVAERAPPVDAYLINGMCNFRGGADGQAQRPVHLEVELEALLGAPVIGHDSALYWRMFKTLGLAPVTKQGRLLASLQAA
ncbi:MAG: hypothetical protein OXU98_01570 [Gammaproteobacteria bacterium]|nr:hypothetical protein [Gammaproteobacteria bacterium]